MRIALVLALTLGLVPPAPAEEAPIEIIPRTVGMLEHDGEQIYYEDIGRGPAIVLGHGLGSNHAIWYQQVAALAPNYRVIVWDQRGFGRSTNRQDAANPRTAVNDLKALLDALEVDRAHVVGQSMGGWAALGFALAYPERTQSVVLSGSIAGIYTPAIAAQFDDVIRQAMRAPSPEARPLGLHPAVDESLAQRDPARAYLYQAISSLSPPPSPSMGLLLRTTEFPLADIAELNVPVLFIAGERDPIFTPGSIREAAEQVPGAHVVFVSEAGHSPYFEQPDAWNKAVAAFLESTDGED